MLPAWVEAQQHSIFFEVIVRRAGAAVCAGSFGKRAFLHALSPEFAADEAWAEAGGWFMWAVR